jgi:Domain of unknown function (DUF4303)
MKWLSKLFGGSAQSSPKMEVPEDEECLLEEITEADWVEFEAALELLLEADIRRFAAEHSEEEFYAVGLDCNSAYCDILLSANTTDALREAAIGNAINGLEEAISAEVGVLRWGFGDWKYHGFNLSGKDDWERYHQILPGGDALHSSEECERFMQAATRALLALERRDAFSVLRKSGHFEVACVDHDEDYGSAKRREDRLRGADA